MLKPSLKPQSLACFKKEILRPVYAYKKNNL